MKEMILKRGGEATSTGDEAASTKGEAAVVVSPVVAFCGGTSSWAAPKERQQTLRTRQQAPKERQQALEERQQTPETRQQALKERQQLLSLQLLPSAEN